MTIRIAPAALRVESTSLLNLVAGEFAARVAAVWPAPHAPFVTAPTARRHLICLALTRGRELAPVAELLLAGRLKRAIVAAVADAPLGLERALARLGDVAWSAADYRKLLTLLAQPRSAKVLRHAGTIEPDMVRRMADLPGPLAEGAPLTVHLSNDAVLALRETYEALRLRAGAAHAEAAAARWVRESSGRRMIAAARADLYPEPASPPHPGTARLRPLASKAAMAAAARRYRNCLAGQLAYAASGWSAYYEWEGPPGAIVEVTRDAIFGWRLEQARVAGNDAVPEALRSEIVSELGLMGVHVGRSCWELERALSTAPNQPFRLRPVAHAVDEAFGD